MLDQDQEDGRAGRGKDPGYLATFYINGPSDPRVDQSKIGVSEQIAWFQRNKCRCLLRGEYMDGSAETCASLNDLE